LLLTPSHSALKQAVIVAQRSVVAVSLALAVLAAPATATASAGNHFYQGYCTWFAAEQAFRTWGVWVPWLGDAGEWTAGARRSGWSVSTQPEADTILVMPPYVQGSGSYGHVGWVIAVDADDGAVTVRSMNWKGWNVTNVHRVAVDGRVVFVQPSSAATGRASAS
jgi:surface antigen